MTKLKLCLMQFTTAHWFNLNIINCIKCCHFPYRNIMAKLKSQHYHTNNINPFIKIFLTILLTFTCWFPPKWLLNKLLLHFLIGLTLFSSVIKNTLVKHFKPVRGAPVPNSLANRGAEPSGQARESVYFI